MKPIIARTPEELAGALGLTEAEAAVWQVQRILINRLKQIVRHGSITDAEIAKRAGISRARVTAVLNGDIHHVPSDLLIRILAELGYRVRVSVVRSAARSSKLAAANKRACRTSSGSSSG